jgi:hypothetical protein
VALPHSLVAVDLLADHTCMLRAQVVKEWQCSLRGNFFGALLITPVLLAVLAAPHSKELAQVLFWLGAPAAMLLSIIRVGQGRSGSCLRLSVPMLLAWLLHAHAGWKAVLGAMLAGSLARHAGPAASCSCSLLAWPV